MGSIDALRSLYPSVLDVNRSLLNEISSGLDEDALAFWEDIVLDLHRYRQNPHLEGWLAEDNHFTAMDTSVSFDRVSIQPDVLSATHQMVAKALAWLGIGVWPIAECYYKTALCLAFVSNNYLSALICGANLGLCYLGGEDITSAYRLATQILPLAIGTNNRYPGTRIATIKRIALGQMGRWKDVQKEARKLQIDGFSEVDDAVDQILSDIYKSTQNHSALASWKKNWRVFNTRSG